MRGADSVVSVGAVRFGCGGAEDSDSASSRPGLRAGDDSSLAMLASFILAWQRGQGRRARGRTVRHCKKRRLPISESGLVVQYCLVSISFVDDVQKERMEPACRVLAEELFRRFRHRAGVGFLKLVAAETGTIPFYSPCSPSPEEFPPHSCDRLAAPKLASQLTS